MPILSKYRKDNLKNIDIDMVILENIDIDIDIDMYFLEDIDIDKEILKNIDIVIGVPYVPIIHYISFCVVARKRSFIQGKF